MAKEYINGPLIAKLIGGPLDGDEFEMAPNGSVLPPMRFSYVSRAMIDGEDKACWINYEHKGRIAEWPQGTALYEYSGVTPMY